MALEQRTYPGAIDPTSLAQTLVAGFSSSMTRAQWFRAEHGAAVVQIQTLRREPTDPSTAITVYITPLAEGGVTIAMDEQAWLNVIADLARSGILTLLRPLSLLHEADNIARNVSRLQLRQQVWDAIDTYCRKLGSQPAAGKTLETVICPYCGRSNPIGELECQGCKAPLGAYQPVRCARCGYLNEAGAKRCARCGIPF